MSVSSGTTLGTYTITALIGAGGMGEVYQARDSKLDRDVAIKVLPEQFARDQERLARFQREAKLLASLNHPNIATIHGLEQSGETHYLVMELVPGETLAERIRREGRVPVEDTLAIGKQIAEALEAAHESEKGIIHRDLKPANVKVTPEGKVKVLDFGLAKAFAVDTASQDFSNSPTLSVAPTMHGVIMGTAAYMSPEQARGRPVTKATDIFAFGAVMYELLTGAQAFQGEDVGDILATVVKTEPDWSKLPGDTPPTIRTLLKRCLRKDRRQRLSDAGAVRIEIEDAIGWIAGGGAKEEAATAPAPIGRSAFPGKLAWAVAGAAIVAALAGWGAFAYFRPVPQQADAMRFFVSPPDGWRVAALPIAVSPDGKRVAFAATNAEGRTQLWVRSLDALAAQPLPEAEGRYASPFWSADSRFLGFFAGGKLMKVEVPGGVAIKLCDVPNWQDNRGGTWSRDGVIVFAPGTNSALQKVSASGGAPTAVTTLAQGESNHRRPVFLPDGQHFIYRALSSFGAGEQIYLGSLDSPERKLLLTSDAQNVVYSQGYLLYLREATLMAQPFDARRLELSGQAFPVADDIQTTAAIPPTGVFAASDTGVLAYRTGVGAAMSQLTWYDRGGKQAGLLGGPDRYADMELSPDGKRVAIGIVDQAKGTRDIWIYDVARGLKTRLTFDPGNESASAWSPDGSRVVFSADRKGVYDLYQKPSNGAGSEEILLEDTLTKWPQSWSLDGRFILYFTAAGSPRTSADLFVLPLSGDRKPVPFQQTQFNEARGRFSPDGRWIAYQSNESGRYEIYVAPFPGPGGKWQVSIAGGTLPRWRRDGTEIFYLVPDGNLMAAAVNGKGASFEVGAVKPLFETRAPGGGGYSYDVSPDGQRFLIATVPEQASDAPITVVVNWAAGVKK